MHVLWHLVSVTALSHHVRDLSTAKPKLEKVRGQQTRVLQCFDPRLALSLEKDNWQRGNTGYCNLRFVYKIEINLVAFHTGLLNEASLWLNPWTCWQNQFTADTLLNISLIPPGKVILEALPSLARLLFRSLLCLSPQQLPDMSAWAMKAWYKMMEARNKFILDLILSSPSAAHVLWHPVSVHTMQEITGTLELWLALK